MTAHGIIRNHQRALRIDSASIQTKDTISNPTLVVVGHGPLSGISHFSGGFCVFCNPISSIRQSYRGTYGEDMRSCKNWTATTLVKTTPPCSEKALCEWNLSFQDWFKMGCRIRKRRRTSSVASTSAQGQPKASLDWAETLLFARLCRWQNAPKRSGAGVTTESIRAVFQFQAQQTKKQAK